MRKQKMPKIEELFDAGVHFGHQIKRWHPNMEKYIFSVKKNIHIINLEDTLSQLDDACEFMYQKAKNGEQIVFVGTKRQAKEIIESEAKRCGAKYVTERWLGGTITNFGVIKKNIDKLVDMIKKREEGEYQKYTKKERLMLDREIDKLQLSVGGIVGLNSKPGIVFVVDSKREKTAVKESRIADIPVVALIDTNSDPKLIDYPIPGNDDAIKSIAMIVKTLADAVELGYKEYDPKKVKIEKKKEETKEVDEAPEERKVIKVTSDAEELIVDEDLSDNEDIEKIEDDSDNTDPGEDEKTSKKGSKNTKEKRTKKEKLEKEKELEEISKEEKPEEDKKSIGKDKEKKE